MNKIINGTPFKVNETVIVKEADGNWKGRIIFFRPGGWVVLHDVTHGHKTNAVYWRREESILKYIETDAKLAVTSISEG